ncbi:D-glycero-beta-D-manno-heptose-7-phosphate kinase [Verrucomicrobium sp. BvORR106]|uniref:D-glycero-beta-D-manno-heptose-7-phosphate kinase n=1 Tax=Verrucomicrobium sp. BvORR106 TaxID=1403819 RepID=UPI0005708236|nr:D-glycero-beta-D-manno-heptose-7-phosphate kinase [Verrucomicrobium sp. BvORR106]
MTSADLDRFRQTRILVIGDVMLDHFVRGNVRRISPEAPVPVVEVTEETFNPGGAANVACNIGGFSNQVSLMGRIGRDHAADHLGRLLQSEGVGTQSMLVSNTIPTISKARVVARQQQIVRVDREKLVALTAEELEEVEQKLTAAAGSLDAIILEDYGKGFITEALMRTVTRIAQAANILVTVDPSPRNPLPWSGVSLVKPNRLEAFAAAGLEDHHLAVPAEQNEELLRVGRTLLERWDTPMVLVTLGEQGMMLFRRDEAPHHIPTRAREVYDVSGAGDTAIAVLTMALASGMDPVQAADVANHASGIVVGKLGTACVTPAELLAAYGQ